MLFFYAGWTNDIEMVRWIINDLHKLINIYTVLDRAGILRWTLNHSLYFCSRNERNESCLDDSIDICETVFAMVMLILSLTL